MSEQLSRREIDEQNERILLCLLVGTMTIFSLPAVLAGFGLGFFVPRRRGVFAGAALAGAGITVLLWGPITDQMSAAMTAFREAGGIMESGQSYGAAWPHVRAWWLLALGTAPGYALIFELLRPKQVDELRERREFADRRREARAERRARRAVGAARPPRREAAIALGRHVSGEQLLPVHRGRVSIALSRLAKTVLVAGSPGSGKTETLLRLAYGAASATDWSVFVLDAKGDPQTQQRFAAAMHAAGRRAWLFPQQSYNGWRGDGRELTNRLVALIDWAQDGGGTYYRDLSVNLVRLACTAPKGPPRSSKEFLARLDKATLASLWAGQDRARQALAFKDEHIDACRQRYGSFFDSAEGQLDGRTAFEDVDCGYLLLNELAYGEETTKLARFLIEDFEQHVATRKPRDRRVLLIIDEFSAIADGARMARVVEVVRTWGGTLVLAPQAYEGMGGAEAAARILNTGHTTFLHAMPEPEPFIRAAGTRLAIEQSVQHDAGRSLDLGSAREQHQYKVDPNEVRRLQPGMCFVIGSGGAQKVQIAPVPSSSNTPPRTTTWQITSEDDHWVDRPAEEPPRL